MLAALPYDGRPPKGEVNPALTFYPGIEAEIARAVAGSLDVDVRFAPSSRATPQLPSSADVHLSFPPVLAQPAKPASGHATRPYLIAYERLLVRHDSTVERRSDLADGTACVLDNEKELERDVPTARNTITAQPSVCIDLLKRGAIEAIVGVDVVLAGLAREACEDCVLTGEKRKPLPLRAVVPEGDEELADRFSSVVEAAREDGRWQRWYEQWIGAYTAPPDRFAAANGDTDSG